MLGYLIIFLVIGILGYYTYYFRIPHSYYKYLSFITADAKITDISHSKESWGREKFIKTVVKFSDGFEYHTHKTFSEPRILYTKIYVDEEVRKEILIKAIKAHDRLVQKKIKKFHNIQE